MNEAYLSKSHDVNDFDQAQKERAYSLVGIDLSFPEVLSACYAVDIAARFRTTPYPVVKSMIPQAGQSEWRYHTARSAQVVWLSGSPRSDQEILSPGLLVKARLILWRQPASSIFGALQFAGNSGGQGDHHNRPRPIDFSPVNSTSDYERIHPGRSPERIF